MTPQKVPHTADPCHRSLGQEIPLEAAPVAAISTLNSEGSLGHVLDGPQYECRLPTPGNVVAPRLCLAFSSTTASLPPLQSGKQKFL